MNGSRFDNFIVYDEETTVKHVGLADGFMNIGGGDVEYDKGTGETWLYNFAIQRQFRGRGLGQYLFKQLIDKYGVDTLAVRKDNACAIHIYKKYGFEIVGELENFAEGASYKMRRKR